MVVRSVALILLAGSLTSAAVAQEKELAEAISDLRAEVASLKESVRSLEKQIQTSGGDQPVSIRVETAAGAPLAGYKVRLTSKAKPAVRATGTSGEDGSVMDRSLPYGDYQLRVTGAGWSASRTIHIEYGQPLSLAIRAPAPDEQATVELAALLDRDRFAGLPFGLIGTRHNNYDSTSYTPEPSEIASPAARPQDDSWPTRDGRWPTDAFADRDAFSAVPQRRGRQSSGDSRWSAFPAVDNGILAVSVRATVSVERSLEMSNGQSLRWVWRHGKQYRLSENGEGYPVRFLQGVERQARAAAGKHPFFDTVEDPKNHVVTRAYEAKSRSPSKPLQIKVPAGSVSVAFGSPEGAPSQSVLDSLTLNGEVADYFLPVQFQRESAWVERLFDLNGWRRKPEQQAYGIAQLRPIATQTVTVEPGESRRFTLRSAATQP